jgi:hypothetical protein
MEAIGTVHRDNRATLINAVFRDCLYKDSEVADGKTPTDAVVVEGILGRYGFNPIRVEENRENIVKLLTGLPPSFYAESGGGYTTLQLAFDANDDQWGEHRNVDQLCALAIATKTGQFCLPRGRSGMSTPNCLRSE